MSRFFQRLVRRANGAAESIQPRSPALFESMPGKLHAPVAMERTPLAHGPSESPAPSLRFDIPSADASTTVTGARSEASAPGAPGAATSEPSITTVASLAGGPLQSAPPIVAPSMHAPSMEQPRATAPVSAPNNTWDPAPAPPRMDNDAGLTATSVRQHTNTREDGGPHAKVDVPFPRPAVSLSPLVVHTRPARRENAPRPLMANPIAHSEAQNVVQVTIEHFEVRASDTSASKPKARARPRRDDSLADYTRRRQELKR